MEDRKMKRLARGEMMASAFIQDSGLLLIFFVFRKNG